MDTPHLDDVLEHYGVKGMRWGVIRTKEQLARASGRAGGSNDTSHKGKVGEIAVNARTGRVGRITKTDKQGNITEFGPSADGRNQRVRSMAGVQNLTTKELQAYLNRARLEQEYNRLNAPQPSVIRRKGADFVNQYVDHEIEKLAKGNYKATTTYKVGSFFVDQAIGSKKVGKHRK